MDEFGLSVLTWNVAFGDPIYKNFFEAREFGGRTGHTSLKLTLPNTPENRALIESLNIPLDEGAKTKNKLVYRERSAFKAIPKDDAEDPKDGVYAAEATTCLEVFFSFWADPASDSQESEYKHRLIEETKDRIEQRDGKQVAYSEKGIKILQLTEDDLIEHEWRGILGGSQKVQNPIPHIYHLGTKEVDIDAIKDELTQLKQDEQRKKTELDFLKKVDKALSKFDTPEEKDSYIQDQSSLLFVDLRAQGINNLADYEQFRLNFKNLSASIAQRFDQLEELGLVIGEEPEGMVHLPIAIPGQSKNRTVFQLDYAAMLKEMAIISNNYLKYSFLTDNCCKVAIAVLRAGLHPELAGKLNDVDLSIPGSSFLTETPQSAYNFAQELSGVFIEGEYRNAQIDPEFYNSEETYPQPEPIADAASLPTSSKLLADLFWINIEAFFVSIWTKIIEAVRPILWPETVVDFNKADADQPELTNSMTIQVLDGVLTGLIAKLANLCESGADFKDEFSKEAQNLILSTLSEQNLSDEIIRDYDSLLQSDLEKLSSCEEKASRNTESDALKFMKDNLSVKIQLFGLFKEPGKLKDDSSDLVDHLSI